MHGAETKGVWRPVPKSGSRRQPRGTISDSSERIERMASGSEVMIFGISTCCMCHAVKRLFFSLGVIPRVHDIDKDPRRRQMEGALLLHCPDSLTLSVPVVFVGGRLVGSSPERIFASHIDGTLVTLLRDAGAL